MASLAISVAVNGSLLYSFDRAGMMGWQRTDRAALVNAHKKDRLEFEFVEAPPKVKPQTPAKTKRIAMRDAVNQSPKTFDSSALTAPLVDKIGPADQLMQKRGSGGAKPSPEVKPVKASRKSEETPENRAQKTQKTQKVLTEGPGGDSVVAPAMQSRNQEEQKPQRAMEARQGASGTPGNARIDTEEMAKTKTLSAQFFGITSFEATGSGMGEYMKRLKEKVWLAWYPYLAFSYPQDYRSADVVLSIRLDMHGNIKSVQVLDSFGEPHFATYCVEAVQKAGNLGALPEEMRTLLKDEELEIKFGFHYR